MLILSASTQIRNVLYLHLVYQSKYCICWCNLQLLSPSPAGSRHRSMCHLCRDRTPLAPHSAWWLNVSTPWSGIHTDMQRQVWIMRNIQEIPVSRSSEAPLWATHLFLSQNRLTTFPLVNLTCRSSGDTPSAGPPLQAAGPRSISYSPQALG